MNKIIRNISIAVLGLLTVAACVKTDGEFEDNSSIYYHAADSRVLISGDATEAVLHVDADCSWNIFSQAEWLQVIPQSGKGAMDVTLIANSTNMSTVSERQTFVILTTQDGIIKRINVVQAPSETRTLSVSPTSLSFDALAVAKQSLTIECNASWSVVGAPDWIELSSNAGQGNAVVEISCQPNTAVESRQCQLTVSAENDLSETIVITQDAATLPVLGTLEVFDVQETQVRLRSVITESMFAVTEYGFCYGTSPDPTTEQKWPITAQNETFEGIITELKKKQTYYVCAYAVSPVGIAYSNVVSFTTLSKPDVGDNVTPSY